jgi:uncharacterized protein (TIGR02145 family)
MIYIFLRLFFNYFRQNKTQTLMTGKILTLAAVATILFFSTHAQNIPDYVPQNGLVGWWPFNGNANDESGNGNNGTVNGATLTTDRLGKSNMAYAFDGNDWIEVLNSASLNSASNVITISSWFKIGNWYNVNNDGWFPIISKSNTVTYGNYRTGIVNKQGSVSFYSNLNSDQAVALVTLQLNTWNQIITTINDASNLASIYLNGILIYQGSTSFTGWSTTNTMPLFFGVDRPGITDYAIGSLDDIAIWNRTLTQQEITNLYNAQSPCIANITNNDSTICLGESIMLNAAGSSNDASVSDIDGNAYPIVKIGSQMWTQKNLNVSRYRNGDTIPQVTDPTEWTNLKTGAWCWYNNDSASYAATYGKIYNFYAVKDPRGLAPNGWRVPSENDWQILSNFLGGDAVAGGKLKTTGTSVWFTPNTGATNESGFNGLPGGDRNLLSYFGGIGVAGNWWTTDYNNNSFPPNTYVYVRSLSNVNTNLQRSTNYFQGGSGVSVRLTKDYSYLWSTGETTPSITVAPTQTTTYYVTITDGISICKDSVTITVNGAITQQPTTKVSNNGQNVQFTTSASSTNSIAYQWQTNSNNLGWQNVPNNSTYSGASTNILTVANVQLSNHNQPFRVIATSGNCVDTSNVALIKISDTCLLKVTDTLVINTVISNLTSPNNENTIKIYPNPTSSQIVIDYGSYTRMNGYIIRINNSIGQQVFTSLINKQQSIIDISSLGSKGIYFVQIIDPQSKVIDTRKIILQ